MRTFSARDQRVLQSAGIYFPRSEATAAMRNSKRTRDCFNNIIYRVIHQEHAHPHFSFNNVFVQTVIFGIFTQYT